jgi:hypothetical protein
MKTLSTWNFKSIAGKIMLGFVLVTMIGSINVAPALGKDNHKSMGKHDNGRYDHRGRGYNHDRDYRPYGYYGHRERVYYPPPPVVYVEPPAPGIGIFFPPIFIHP